MSWRMPFLSRPKRCALCKQPFDAAKLLPLDGRLVCRGCLELMRAEGLSFPDGEAPEDDDLDEF